jgi:hypothetical protein
VVKECWKDIGTPTPTATGKSHIQPLTLRLSLTLSPLPQDDFRVCVAAGVVNNLEIPCPIDLVGKYTAEITPYKGMYIKDADKVREWASGSMSVREEGVRNAGSAVQRLRLPLLWFYPSFLLCPLRH